MYSRTSRHLPTIRFSRRWPGSAPPCSPARSICSIARTRDLGRNWSISLERAGIPQPCDQRNLQPGSPPDVFGVSRFGRGAGAAAAELDRGTGRTVRIRALFFCRLWREERMMIETFGDEYRQLHGADEPDHSRACSEAASPGGSGPQLVRDRTSEHLLQALAGPARGSVRRSRDDRPRSARPWFRRRRTGRSSGAWSRRRSNPEIRPSVWVVSQNVPKYFGALPADVVCEPHQKTPQQCRQPARPLTARRISGTLSIGCSTACVIRRSISTSGNAAGSLTVQIEVKLFAVMHAAQQEHGDAGWILVEMRKRQAADRPHANRAFRSPPWHRPWQRSRSSAAAPPIAHAPPRAHRGSCASRFRVDSARPP